MKGKEMLNNCGECQECCVSLAVVAPGIRSPAGEKCKHQCAKGCELHGTAAQPKLCRVFQCCWRRIPWMNSRPQYRPDKLGVIMFPCGEEYKKITLVECRPQAFENPTVRYINNRLFAKYDFDVSEWQEYGVQATTDLSNCADNGDGVDCDESRITKTHLESDNYVERRVSLKVI